MTTSARFALLLVFLATATVLISSGKAAAQPEGAGAIMAVEEKPSGSGGRATSGTSEAQGKTASSRSSSALPAKTVVKTSPKTVRTSTRSPRINSSGKYTGPVIGDSYSFLNFEIAEKVQPVWTLAAKNAGAIGLVQVTVLIDEDGSVLQARARTGNPLLYPEAEKAALATTFNQPTVNGRPARALGFIVFRFGTEEQEYEQEQKNKKPSEESR